MNTTVKVISVDGDVWRFSNTNKKLILKKGAKLQAKDVLHLSEESNVVLQLSNGRVVEIHGKDLINNDGNFSLNSLLVESNSDIDKIVNFAKFSQFLLARSIKTAHKKADLFPSRLFGFAPPISYSITL